MGSVTYYLTVGVGLACVLLGTLKVAPIEPAHGNLVSYMHKFAGVFPLRAVGFQPSGAMYCAVMAVLDIFFGALLAFGRYDWPVISCFVLLVISALYIHGLLALSAPMVDFFFPVLLAVLLLLLMFGRHGLWGGYGKIHLA
ncbi:transmembrane protein 35B [Strongylocentrotus purpuratus]|uniref:DoxX family protein n=1 Tax=Strongylocentrotus purpuratus TaxID=7668 RepID=A0A7M7RFW4_STRPU|nr:transmembrane protein 35B [Strongylocentrotus purpuratus]